MYTTRGKAKMSGKKPSHRDAIIKSLLIELIRNERLQSTPNKVKILKAEFDKLVNTAKQNTEASKRNVESKLTNNLSVEKLYKMLPRLDGTTSGYTISARTLPRKGDNAAQVIVMIKGSEIKEKRSRLSATLEKQDKSAKSEGVAERIKNVVSGPKKVGAGNTKQKSSIVNVRRNSK